MIRSSRTLLATVVATLLAVSVSAALADTGGPPSFATATDSDFVLAKKAIDEKDWNKAIRLLDRVKVDADVLNYRGYAHRNLGNFDEAFRNYQRALEMDPNHRGAHEYVGEAYLLTNNLAMAEEHLAALNRICGSSCEEYKDLAREVAEFKKKHSAQR